MDTRGLGSLPGDPDSRRRARRSPLDASTRPEDAGEATFHRFRMGRIDAVHVTSNSVTVQLFHGAAGSPSLAPIDLFPSVAWAEGNIGRWVILNGPAGAKVVPGPKEIISHAVDPKTNELVLSCVVCKAETGRLPEDIAKKGPRAMIDQVKLTLSTHLSNFHPEIIETLK